MTYEDYESELADEPEEEDVIDEYAEASEQYSAEQAAYMAEHSDDPNVAAEYAQEAHDHLENCDEAPSGLVAQVEDTVYESYYEDKEDEEVASADEVLTDTSGDAFAADHSIDCDMPDNGVDDNSVDSSYTEPDVIDDYSDAADDTMDAGASENTY